MSARDAIDVELFIQPAGAVYSASIRVATPESEADSFLATNVPIALDRGVLLALTLDSTSYGRELTTQLFTPGSALIVAWRDACRFAEGGNRPLRLRLHLAANATDIHDLRWETLHDPLTDAPFATDGRLWLARYLQSADLRPITLEPRPALSALLVVASPHDLTNYGMAEIDVEGEVGRVRQALGNLPLTIVGDVEGSVSRRATFGAIREALRAQPTIFCLICHSKHNVNDTMLWLENDEGNTSLVEGSLLSQMFDRSDGPPLLAVLIACEGGGDSHHSGPLAALGPSLASSGIGAVVAMQAKVSINAAKRLLRTLFEEVIHDGRIDRAVSVARAALSEYDEWWVPVLWLRTKKGRLWHDAIGMKQQTSMPGLIGEVEYRLTTKLSTESSLIQDAIFQQGSGLKVQSDAILKIQSQLDTLLQMQIQGENTGQDNESRSDIDVKIDIARKLSQERQFVAARKMLFELQMHADETRIAEDTRARIFNLLGACAFGVGELQLAQSYFGEAVSLAPSNVGMITNSAMVALVSGMPELALDLSQRARRIDTKDPNAASVYIQALHHLGRYFELEKVLLDEPWITDYAIGAGGLASVRSAQGKHEEAEALLRKAISLDPADPQLYILVANRILAGLEIEDFEDALHDNQIVSRLKDAENAFSQAVGIYERGDDRVSLHAALISRAGVRCAIGEFEAGLSDYNRVLAEDPVNKVALENKSRVLLNSGRALEAIACLETITNDKNTDDTKPSIYTVILIGSQGANTTLLLASAYIEAGQSGKAVELLLPAFEISTDYHNRIAIAELLLIAYQKTHKQSAIEGLLQVLTATWPNQVEAIAVVAGHYVRQGNYDYAIPLLQEAIALAKEPLRTKLIFKIAYVLYQAKRYADAADILRHVVKREHDNPDLRLFIVCLYNSQQFSEALALAHFVRQVKGVVIGVSEIEALILERGGDVFQAKEIWWQFTQVYPENISFRVNAAHAEWRSGNKETAKQILLDIPYEAVKTDATLLINIAHLRSFLHLPDILLYAYQARRITINNPDVHVQYMMLCLHCEGAEQREALVAPDVVGVDTGVTLTRNSNTTLFLIVDDSSMPLQQGELHVSDSLAQKLIGRRVGDHVVLQETFAEAPEYEITEIKGKYVYASHQSIHMFESGNLRHPGFYVDNVTDDDFIERFTRFLDLQAQAHPEIRALYTRQGVPLCAFAQMIGRPVIDVWLAFIETPGERLFSADGTTSEVEIQDRVLTTSTAIVIDLIALLTIIHLSLEEIVTQRFSTIFVPQAILDLLHQYEHELEGLQPHGAIGSSGGERFFLEYPPDYMDIKRKVLRKALEFIRNSAQVRPTMTIVREDQEIIQILGEAEIASILLAKELNVALYSDDLRIRVLATQHWGVSGFDSQAILRDLRARSLLSQSCYYSALCKLAQSNYHFIRVDVEILVFALEQGGMTITKDVQELLKLIQGPDCNQESAVQVIAELIKQVWIRAAPQHQKLMILDLALTTLFSGRKSAQVAPALKNQLLRKFWLIDFKLNVIFAHIDYWANRVK